MRKIKLFLACMLMLVFGFGQMWAAADVTYDFTDGSWSVSSGTLSNGIVSFTGAGADNFKMNSGYFMMGKKDAYLNFPTYGSAVAKIVITGRSGASGSTKQNIYVGDVAVSTETTGVTGENTYEIASGYQDVGTVYTLKVTSTHNTQVTKIEIFYASASGVAAPSFTPNGGSFLGSQSVTLTQTANKDIYYTTDGTAGVGAPSTSAPWALYSSAIDLTETTTIYAAAKDGDNWSSVVSKTFTKMEELTTMDAIFSAATAAGNTATDVYITFNDWIVSGAKGNTAYVTDGTKGFIVYYSGHGFNEGDILSGTGSFKLKLYNGAAEITAKNSGTITATPGGSATLNVLDAAGVDALSGVNTGSLIKISGEATSTSIVAGVTLYKTIYEASSLPSLETGKNYNCTGVYVQYNSTKEMMPRVAADIEEVVAAGAPDAPTFSPDGGTYTEAQNVTISCATDGAVIYYTTDGSAPTTSSNVYSTPIAVSADMTIKAIAVKNDVESALATATYMLNVPLTTIDAIFNKATIVGGTATDVTVELDNWVVSGIKGSNAFVTDGTKGFIIYASGHGFNVGDVLSGTVACKVQLYKGSAELTTLTSSTEGITVTPGGSAVLNTKTIDQLSAINTGALVKIENVTYDASSTSLSDGVNTIKPFNGLFSSMTFEDGNDYNVVGVVNYYDALQIMPRSADDIVNLSVVSVTGINLTESTAEVEVGSTVTLHASVEPSGATNKTIVWSVTSGDDKASVAGGVVTGLAEGTAVIRAASDEDATIYEECTVTVTAADPTKHVVTFDATVDKGESPLSKSNITFTCSNGVLNNESEYRLYKNSETTFECSAGNIIKIEFTGVSGNPVSGFEDPAIGTLVTDGNNGVWTGNATSVTFTASGAQVRATAINVTYKEDNRAEAGLAWDPAGDIEITVGDAFSAPALSNPNSIAAAEITIGSSNTSLATVTAGVVELVADATGEATITATFAGNDDYKAATVSYKITVNAAPVVLTDYYEKVTNTAGIVEGTYLIVYEEGSLAFDGGLATLDAVSNSIAVDITTDNKIGVTSATEAATFYIDPTAGTIKSASDHYIGVSSWSNGLKQTDTYVHNVLEIDGDGNAQIGIYNAEWNTTGGTMRLQYNKGSGQTRFRYFKDGGQQPIALYKLHGEVIKPAAGLAWDPAANIEITVGDAFTAPTLDNPNNIDAAEITIESSNTSLATVTAGIVELVADATGTATITATFAGNASFKPATVSYTIKVNPASSIYVDPSLYVNFGSVEKDAAAPADQTITVTLNNVAAATAALGGTNPGAFSITPATLTASGDITISVVSTATVGEYKATLTISDDAGAAASKEVKLSFTVTDPASEETPVETTSKWVAATEITDGMQVLITGVKSDVTYAIGEQGSNNRAAVAGTLEAGVFTPGANTMAFTLVATGAANTYYIKTSNNQYLYNASSSTKSYLRTKAAQEEVSWTITLDGENNAVITSVENTNRQIMRFNTNGSNDPLFNCYASGQTDIKLYVPQAVTPTADYTRDDDWIAPGQLGTVCISHGVTSISGANIYQVAGKQAGGNVVFESVATMEPGKPYLFEATSDHVDFFYSLEAEAASAGNHKGMYGTFGDITITDDLANTYYFAGHTLWSAVDLTSTGLSVPANRAYIKMDEVPDMGASPAPGKRYITLSVNGNNGTTGIGELNASETPVKMIIDGKLFILRGEKMYNANGQLVK